MTPDEIQNNIESQQRSIAALQAEMQQATDRQQSELIPGLQQQITDHSNQMQRMQGELVTAQQKKAEEEAEKAAEEARKEQKKKDNGFGIF